MRRNTAQREEMEHLWDAKTCYNNMLYLFKFLGGSRKNRVTIWIYNRKKLHRIVDYMISHTQKLNKCLAELKNKTKTKTIPKIYNNKAEHAK